MNSQSIRLLLDAAKPASRIDGTIPVGTMASGAVIGLNFVAVKGAKNGPCLWINGQVHGDEVNGIIAALDFLADMDLSQLRGSIVLSSSANPLALDVRQKNAPQDGYDLDQIFPGQPEGFITERMAHALMEQVIGISPSLLINMHTMPQFMSAEPYAVYKRDPNGRVSEEAVMQYLASFQPRMACLVSIDPGRGERLGNLAGALDNQMLALGIPSFMLELGSGSKANPDHIAQGIRGFTNVARRMGMIPGEPDVVNKLVRVTKRRRVTFPNGGLFRAFKKPGEIVAADELVGKVMDLRGREVDALRLPYDHMIIGIRSDPTVHTGDWFCFVALEWDEVEL